MSVRNRLSLCAFAAVVALSLACGISTFQPEAMPTLEPGGINTIIAMTAGAALTQTAAAPPLPTATAEPSLTPTITVPPPTNTPTLTPTIIFVYNTMTPTRAPTSTYSASQGSGGYACQITSQSPGNGTSYDPRDGFDATWKVKNVGDKDWEAGSIDFIFSDGKNLSEISGYDINDSVDVGGSIKLGLDMTAPKKPGTYTSTWVLTRGDNEFCTLSVWIVVK